MNWTILQKYLKGTCTEDELRKLGEWLEASPANEDFFSSFIESYKDEDISNIKTDAREAWKEFKKREETHYNKESSSNKAPNNKGLGKSKGREYKWYYSAAAAIILVISIVFIAEDYTGTVKEAGEEKFEAQEITTTKGQRTNLKLSDGSEIVLNSESKLLIPKDYEESSRMVYLEGEAFFDVDHDEDHPFVVITSQGYVEDLGTQFNVKSYDSTKIEVALKEGLASLGEVKNSEPEKDLAKLTPNKLGVLSRQDGLTVSDIENMSVFTGWTEGKLVFNRSSFSEVAQRLERWYDIEIIIDDRQITERTLSATYDNMPLNEVLNVLSASLRLSYERDGRTVIFSG